MKKRDQIIYYVVTGLFSLLMVFSAGMYIFAHDVAVEAFTRLGFPIYIIYPLAVAKLLGLVAIWTNKSKPLKQWAYAGFVFDLLLASSAHIMVGDGEFPAATGALVLVLVSFFLYLRWEKAKLATEEEK